MLLRGTTMPERFGEAPALGLAHALRRLGFPTKRLKTGTPPRIDKTSVDYAVMLALIIVVCIAAITSVGANANNTFSFAGNKLKVVSS